MTAITVAAFLALVMWRAVRKVLCLDLQAQYDRDWRKQIRQGKK